MQQDSSRPVNDDLISIHEIFTKAQGTGQHLIWKIFRKIIDS
jgi:hypothetical protein